MDSAIVKINGRDVRLRFTLGVLEALETELSCESISEVVSKLATGKGIRTAAREMAKASGETVTDDELRALSMAKTATLIESIGDLIKASFPDGDDGAESGEDAEKN